MPAKIKTVPIVNFNPHEELLIVNLVEKIFAVVSQANPFK